MYWSLKSYVHDLWGVLGGIFVILGITCIICEPFKNIAINMINKEARLIDGTIAYNMWNIPLNFLFMVYIFNVTNPVHVLKGLRPNLTQHGPYVYDQLLKREILEIDEATDEIKFVIRRKFRYNRFKNTNVSEDDTLTVLNMAYMSILTTLNSTGTSEDFLKKFGNAMPNLFPNSSTIFITEKVKNIIFNGLKITCNSTRFSDLSPVCTFLETNRSSIIMETGKEGVYLFSLFNHMNNSVQGPFTINRGVKNISQLGDITSYRDNRIQKVWRNEVCNFVSGKDIFTWPPRQERLSELRIFSADICRQTSVDYTDEVIINGIKAERYMLTRNFYTPVFDDCYCPKIMKQVECPPNGLLDLSKCQGLPIFFSEPHFLHGSSDLLFYSRDMKPDETLHYTDIFINQMTGLPMTGYKRAQFSMILNKLPVNLLTNVSKGYLPLVWTTESYPINMRFISYAHQTQRIMFLCEFLRPIPIIIGICIILATIFLHGGEMRKIVAVSPMPQNILISRKSPRVHHLEHGNTRR